MVILWSRAITMCMNNGTRGMNDTFIMMSLINKHLIESFKLLFTVTAQPGFSNTNRYRHGGSNGDTTLKLRSNYVHEYEMDEMTLVSRDFDQIDQTHSHRTFY